MHVRKRSIHHMIRREEGLGLGLIRAAKVISFVLSAVDLKTRLLISSRPVCAQDRPFHSSSPDAMRTIYRSSRPREGGRTA